MNIGDAIPRNAQHFPNKLAVQDERRSLTFGDLHERTNRLGNYLLGQGVLPGDIVAVSCGNRCEHLEVLFALARIGVTIVPFDYNWSERERAAMLAFYEPKAYLVEQRKETAGAIGGLVDRWSHGRMVLIGGDGDAGVPSYDRIMESAAGGDPAVRVDGKDPYLIMTTSGTTGFPKGCIINHETYVLRSLNNAIHRAFHRDARALLTLPLQFNAGRGSTVGVLFIGGTVFIHERFNEEAFLKLIEEERITFTVMVPTQIERLMKISGVAERDTGSLEYVGVTGGHLAPDLVHGMAEKVCPNISQAYASTDCGQSTMLTPAHVASHGDTVGRPVWSTLVGVLDDTGNELPIGSEGEICVQSPLVIQGYYQNPEATEEFFQGGWCHTGDIGYLDNEGYLRLSGRKKNMIKSGGISIFPEEIEDALLQHDKVEEVAVVGIKSDEWGEAVKALVVLKQGAKCDPETLIAFCKQTLTPYKAPKAVEFVASIPRTGLGKIDRGKIAAIAGDV